MTTTKNPIKQYLAQSVRINGKLILLVLLGILVAGVGVSLIGFIPEHREVVSLILFNLPAKIIVLIVPIILILKSKTYSEWSTANPNITIAKKDFTNATYTELFIASFFDIPILALIWISAHFVYPGMVDLNEGVAILGGSLGVAWGMIGLVCSLQFTKLVSISEGAMVFAVGFFVPFGVVVAIQRTLNAIELPLLFIAGVPALVGLVVLIISRPIAVRLQERVDL